MARRGFSSQIYSQLDVDCVTQTCFCFLEDTITQQVALNCNNSRICNSNATMLKQMWRILVTLYSQHTPTIQTMKLNKLTRFTALSAALVGSTSFAVSNDALLDLLVQKGVLTETEATNVAAELEKDQPVFVTAKSKAIKGIKLTGRVHFQYDNISNDFNDTTQEGFYFRRLYLGAETKFSDDWYGKLIANFGGQDGDAVIDSALVGWDAHEMADLQFGYQKVPFGYYETTSSSKIKTVERSIANRYFIEDDGVDFGGRFAGIFANGDLGDSGFSYKAAIAGSLEGTDRKDKLQNDNDQGLAIFGRLQWKSEKSDMGQLLLGVDAGTKKDGARTEAGNGDMFAYGIHANYSLEGFNLSGEILGTTIDDTTAGDVDVFGFTATPSYKINDKWEVVAAYSYIETDGANLLDADDLVRRSGLSGEKFSEGESYYIGFNYYILGNDLKLSGGYENASFESENGADEAEFDAFRMRLQMLF